jgi:hypothetical protein
LGKSPGAAVLADTHLVLTDTNPQRRLQDKIGLLIDGRRKEMRQPREPLLQVHKTPSGKYTELGKWMRFMDPIFCSQRRLSTASKNLSIERERNAKRIITTQKADG